jgi:hypothetical protein
MIPDDCSQTSQIFPPIQHETFLIFEAPRPPLLLYNTISTPFPTLRYRNPASFELEYSRAQKKNTRVSADPLSSFGLGLHRHSST